MNRKATALALVFAVMALMLASSQNAATASQSPKATASVVRGTTASIQSWPWLAFVEDDEALEGFSCSGTVVAPRLVLTAGHCVEDTEGSGRIIPPEGYTVITGVGNLRQATAGNMSTVEKALVFPGYEPAENKGDAGLLILNQPVSAPGVPLATSDDEALISGGTKIKVAGWGLTEPNNREAPKAFREGTLETRAPEVCDEAVRTFAPEYLPEWQVCARDRAKGQVTACSGDSGGPAIAYQTDGSPVEIGITSFGIADCDPQRMNVFTRVDKISPWVEEWITAIERGGPEPEIRVPEVHLPTLTIPEVKLLIVTGLAEDFGYRFLKARSASIRPCERVEPEKSKCQVAWLQGGNVYFGTATVYISLFEGAAVWDYRYTIHWVNEHCILKSAHPSACVFRTRKR